MDCVKLDHVYTLLGKMECCTYSPLLYYKEAFPGSNIFLRFKSFLITWFPFVPHGGLLLKINSATNSGLSSKARLKWRPNMRLAKTAKASSEPF